jgi:hypothetical protein
MSTRYRNFIQANAKLWENVPSTAAHRGLLLVEPNHHPVISHANAVYARIIGEARGLRIAWIDTGDPAIQDRLRSYDPNSVTLRQPSRSVIDESNAAVEVLRAAACLRSGRDILGLSVDGVVLGDIVYDTYLARNHSATIRKIDAGLLKILWSVIRGYFRARRIVLESNASAVLVSHEVGSSGILMRAALRLGQSVFLRQSGVQLNLKVSTQDVYFNACKPRSVDLAILSSFAEARIEREFNKLMEERMRCDVDAERAYGRRRVHRSKRELANQFGLSPDAPFVFVMLHAFNDHPHSHYGRMLFQDYYCWFKETLSFAQGKEDVNWIFKEHPSSEFYPTRDISLRDHFRQRSSNILFLDRTADFSTESLLHTADAVVTVAGTAGVEFAAAAGIPPIMAGQCHYTGLGFTIDPASKEEYFRLLKRVGMVEQLTKAQQKIAQETFLYSERYAYFPFLWLPQVTYEEERDPNLDSYFWQKILPIYAQQSKQLMAEFEECVRQVREPNFARLSLLH